VRVLFAASEAFPWMKTGGLGDVAGYLPRALQRAGARVTLALPGYADLLARLTVDLHTVTHVPCLQGYALLKEATGPDGVRLWIVDHPLFGERGGNPYVGPDGHPWPDNDLRFGLFNQVLARVVADALAPDAHFDLAHCHDWQTGLLPVYLDVEGHHLPSVFTIHNLSYQGLFPRETLTRLQLPAHYWSPEGLEFHGHFSFIKGGLVYADKLTTVSPTYAREIQTEAFGYGLAGLLRHRSADLVGILNGIDTEQWNPATDPHLPCHYDADHLDAKADCKAALQRRYGWNPEEGFLLGTVGRMVHQKGTDLLLDALPELMELPVRLVLVGSGEAALEDRALAAESEWPGRVGCYIGYDEDLAHLLEAGADAFLMPSRFEPCGLNQMYSQVYGTPPIVSHTGGLADTVVGANDATLRDGTATGFFLPSLDAAGLVTAVQAALALYQQPDAWRRLQRNGMARDFSWDRSAQEYMALYRALG